MTALQGGAVPSGAAIAATIRRLRCALVLAAPGVVAPGFAALGLDPLTGLRRPLAVGPLIAAVLGQSPDQVDAVEQPSVGVRPPQSVAAGDRASDVASPTTARRAFVSRSPTARPNRLAAGPALPNEPARPAATPSPPPAGSASADQRRVTTAWMAARTVANGSQRTWSGAAAPGAGVPVARLAVGPGAPAASLRGLLGVGRTETAREPAAPGRQARQGAYRRRPAAPRNMAPEATGTAAIGPFEPGLPSGSGIQFPPVADRLAPPADWSGARAGSAWASAGDLRQRAVAMRPPAGLADLVRVWDAVDAEQLESRLTLDESATALADPGDEPEPKGPARSNGDDFGGQTAMVDAAFSDVDGLAEAVRWILLDEAARHGIPIGVEGP